MLAQNIVQIIPEAPSFYHKLGIIDELIDFFVGRIIDQPGSTIILCNDERAYRKRQCSGQKVLYVFKGVRKLKKIKY